MKKILSLILILACAFAVLTACNNSSAPAAGVIEDGSKLYFVADGGAVLIENGKATPADAVDGTPSPKTFNAPDTTEDYFVYSEINGKINITGLTDKGKAQAVIVVPRTVNGKDVVMISAGAFEGLNSLVIATPKSSLVIADNALRGVKNVYLAADPNTVEVGENLFSDTADTKVFVCGDMYSSYKSHYSWGTHSAKLSKY